jgi:hypothetical protein
LKDTGGWFRLASGHSMAALILLATCAATAIACNAPFLASTATSPAPTIQPTVDGPAPTITIESPGNNSQALINQAFRVRVRATDTNGITRVEMREAGRIVVSQPSPEPNPDFTALLEYRPTSLGAVTLEVVAFRRSTISAPVTLTVQIVGSETELQNPASLDATSGVAAGAICTLRVNVSGLNLRAGPGTNYRSIGKLKVGDELAVTGRNAASSWYQVRQSAVTGWVSAPYVAITNGNCTSAPETTPSP